MMEPTLTLARHAAEAPRTWPDEVRQAAVRAYVDTLACMVAGRRDSAPVKLAAAAASWGGGGRSLEVTAGARVAAPFAALVNGAAAHALDYDDVLDTALSHASAVFVPALLALGQDRGSSGEELIDALIVAFDVQNAIAAAVNYAHYGRGWHTTLTLGPPAAAAGCARLLGLDTGRTRMAISAAFSFSSGTKLQFGTEMKPTHAGLAAQAGVMAAVFAEQGLSAAPAMLDGPWSFGDLFGAPGMPGFAVMLDRLQGPPALAEPGPWFKAYPCCASAHRPIDGLLGLMRSHRFGPDEVRDVEAHVSDIVFRNLMYERPANAMEARFSLNHCLAVAAHRGGIRIADFSPEAIDDPGLRSFWPKVRMTRDPSLPADMKAVKGAERCRIVVSLADNRVLEQTVVFPSGHPQAPLSDEALGAKFRDCAGATLSPDTQAHALDRLFDLPRERELDALIAMLAPSGP